MLRYLPRYVRSVFQEVPGEVSLLLPLVGCGNTCLNCHSPHLNDEINSVHLDFDMVTALLSHYTYVSCLLFFGGNQFDTDLLILLKKIREEYPHLKLALYTGVNFINDSLLFYLDYYKIGEYREELGGLDKKTTNQRMYKVQRQSGKITELKDITYEFQKGNL